MGELQMAFRNQTKKPAGMVRVAATFLVVAIVWPYSIHPTTKPWTVLSEGVRGTIFGICVGINIIAALQARRQRRCGSRNAAYDGDPRATGNTNTKGELVS
jgi:hypothetical protein